jgi:hypothetical protein
MVKAALFLRTDVLILYLFEAIIGELKIASSPTGKSNFLQVFLIPALKKNDVIFSFSNNFE